MNLRILEAVTGVRGGCLPMAAAASGYPSSFSIRGQLIPPTYETSLKEPQDPVHAALDLQLAASLPLIK
jgi:hypothetical protein